MVESGNTDIGYARILYHRNLLDHIWGYDGLGGRPSNADKGSKISMSLAQRMLANTESPTTSVPKGQGVGAQFAEITKDFIEESFSSLKHLRPGKWEYSTTPGKLGITALEQYAHLATLKTILEDSNQSKEFRTAFATDYLVLPDIVIGRHALTDTEINLQTALVDSDSPYASYTPLRSSNGGVGISLHASVSCKWTIRSDRAQNTRTEALNLIRNRKGNVPHVVVVTAEPMPTRLASLAIGTGDLDCVYHMALHELQQALKDVNDESQAEMFELLVSGRRLRDISDLPFDLAV